MASEIICTTTDPISAIALQYGYKDPGHFSRVFKKVKKLSPLHYRKAYRV